MLKLLLYLSLLFAPDLTVWDGVALSDNAQQILQGQGVSSDLSDSESSDTDEQDGVAAQDARLTIKMVQSIEISYARVFLSFSDLKPYSIRAPPFSS